MGLIFFDILFLAGLPKFLSSLSWVPFYGYELFMFFRFSWPAKICTIFSNKPLGQK